MTEALAGMITAMTCPTCHGEGKLVSSQMLRSPFGPLVRQTMTAECGDCVGTGIAREWKQG